MDDLLESFFDRSLSQDSQTVVLPDEMISMSLYDIAQAMASPTEIIKYDLDE